MLSKPSHIMFNREEKMYHPPHDNIFKDRKHIESLIEEL